MKATKKTQDSRVSGRDLKPRPPKHDTGVLRCFSVSRNVALGCLAQIFNLWFVVCLFSWRYNKLWLYFHSPVAGLSLLVFEVSWSHTTTRHSRQDSPGRVISPSQRPLPHNTQHSQETNIHAPGGIQPTISAGEQPKTYALDGAATGTGI